VNKKVKIAIVGGSPSTRDMAPYDDKSWQIWGTQNRLPQYKRLDLAFEVHAEKHYPTKKLFKQYRKLYGPQIKALLDANKLIWPDNYPYEEATSLRGRWTLQGAISYMIAYAILQNVDEIAIYGVDLVDNHEYLTQRPHVEGWIGFAEGRGIKVTWPKESALGFYPYKYGIEKHTEAKYKGIVVDHPIVTCLVNALKECEVARERYANYADILQMVNTEAECFGKVLTSIQQAQRGADITHAITIPFDEVDKMAGGE
jgi:hypothetical protein